MENKNNEENTQLAVPQEKSVLLQGDPDQQLAYASKASKALVSVISQKPKKVMINGEQYLEFEDWQTLARFYGATVGIEWTKAVERADKDKVWGYEARAVVYLKGEVISSAEAMCLRDERNWQNRDEFALRSMAQTRAMAKALRNVLSWVAVLAGFKPTPAEEMPSDMPPTYVDNAKKVVERHNGKRQAGIAYETPEERAEREEAEAILESEVVPEAENKPIWRKAGQQGECSVEGCSAVITDKVRQYSLEKFGKVYCYGHQPKKGYSSDN